MISRHLLLALALCIVTRTHAGGPDLGSIRVDESGSRPRSQSLRDALPDENHIVIVVDGRSAHQLAFLDSLRREGYPGHRTTLLILEDRGSGNAGRSRSGAIDWRRWEHGRLLHSDASEVKGILGGTSMPQILATDADRQVIWQRSGVSRRPSRLVLTMMEWLR